MFSDYLNRQISRLTDTLIGKSFPQPINTISVPMRHDLDIHTLREFNVRMNGKTVGTCLNYCSSAMSGQEYCVATYMLDSNKPVVLHFPTQDEAEQEYIVRAAYVWACANQATHALAGELEALADKVRA